MMPMAASAPITPSGPKPASRPPESEIPFPWSPLSGPHACDILEHHEVVTLIVGLQSIGTRCRPSVSVGAARTPLIDSNDRRAGRNRLLLLSGICAGRKTVEILSSLLSVGYFDGISCNDPPTGLDQPGGGQRAFRTTVIRTDRLWNRVQAICTKMLIALPQYPTCRRRRSGR